MSPRASVPPVSSLVYRPDIDGLRALAVTMVVAFHASSDLAPGGYLGVDVFFVVSGYLITGLLLQALQAGTFSYADFYARRVRRILPALVVMLGAVWAYGAGAMLVDDFERLGQSMVGAATFSANLNAWRESGYFDVSAPFRPLLHLWSLAVEEQFYLVWPLMLVVWVRATGRARPGILAVLGLSLVGAVWLDRVDPSAAFYAAPTRMWELLAGAALVSAGRVERSAFGALASTAAVVGLVGLAVGARPEVTSAVALECAAVVCALALLQFGASSWIGSRLLSLRPVVAVGRVSYPWYLWHWPLLSLARLSSVAPVGAGARASLVVASLLLAFATHHGVERPLTRAVSSGRLPRAWLWVGGVAACVVLIGLGEGTTRGWIASDRQVRERVMLRHPVRDSVALRERACLIRREQTMQDFAPDCITPATDTSPAVVVWGDSYAAGLAEGLRVHQTPHLAVTQLTAIACPPFTDGTPPTDPGCTALNAGIVDHISTLHDATVVVSAAWLSYSSPPDHAAAQARRVIERLRAHTTARVVLVGVQPTWPEAVPRMLARLGLPPADRLVGASDAAAVAMNDALRAVAKEQNVDFADLLGALCDPQGCLVAGGEPVADHLFTWDDGHLTAEGSQWIAEHALVPILLGR